MKFISPKIHGIIDILVCVFLLASPVIFGFTGKLALFTYALGAAHLLLTVFTDFAMGAVKLIPVSIHELVEFVVAVAVIMLAYTLFNNNADGKLFYVIFGNCLLLTWLVTDYRGDSVHSLS
ncbi:hypothetical protein [Mucilaginibacter xinganensis]|uniref:Uncharacterized protein n=1 Tax=Mucilaginibacter xinganensis TaxID=1234841 RepID=A0A223NPU2_9SPHI|nr:hypothetical protein [Mucilaginibacter xinganensis]ASU31935.1 hypothetical protein MuYL_0032 [Mucilaginibacter xinganensis]